MQWWYLLCYLKKKKPLGKINLTFLIVFYFIFYMFIVFTLSNRFQMMLFQNGFMISALFAFCPLDGSKWYPFSWRRYIMWLQQCVLSVFLSFLERFIWINSVIDLNHDCFIKPRKILAVICKNLASFADHWFKSCNRKLCMYICVYTQAGFQCEPSHPPSVFRTPRAFETCNLSLFVATRPPEFRQKHLAESCI